MKETMYVYVAQIIHQSGAWEAGDRTMVGIFSTEQRAKDAMENLVESTYLSSLNSGAITRSVERFKVDRSVEDVTDRSSLENFW